MAEREKIITSRLKQINCSQKDCRNNNEDNIDVIVFGKNDAKKTGFMCSECLIDSELLQQLRPIEKHSISIRKFMKTLSSKYKEYAQEKNTVNWGPNMIQAQRRQIKQLLGTYQQMLFKGTLQIANYIQDLETKTLQQISSLYKDASFQQLSLLLAQQDDQQQERINVSAQLKSITSNIMQTEGVYKMSNEKQLKQKHEAIVNKYRESFKNAKQTFEKLIDVQKGVLKGLAKLEVQSQN